MMTAATLVMVRMSLFELQERRFQAAEDKAAAMHKYEDIRRALRAKRIDVDTDPTALVALTEYEEAIAVFEVARREHGAALAAHLNARQRGE